MGAVGAVEKPDVEDEPRMIGERLEKAPRDIGVEPADPGVRQIDIRDEQRLVAAFEHDMSKRLRRGEGLGAVPARASDA